MEFIHLRKNNAGPVQDTTKRNNELMQTLHFGSHDLAINRSGFISLRQKRSVKRKQLRFAFWGISCAVLALFCLINLIEN